LTLIKPPVYIKYNLIFNELFMKKLALSLLTVLSLASYASASSEGTTRTQDVFPQLKAYCTKFNPSGEHAESICKYAHDESKDMNSWQNLDDVVGALKHELETNTHLKPAEKQERAKALLEIANRLPASQRTSHPSLFSELEALSK
jgi:hypothetical protein